MQHLTHFVLLQCTLVEGLGLGLDLGDLARQWCAAGPLPLTLTRAARQPQTGEIYVYGQLALPTHLDADVLPAWQDLWAQLSGGQQVARVSRLTLALDAPGVSTGYDPVFHYVVEMDPEAGWQDELFNWYDTEHMPGLANVPGCIRARRLINHDHGPYSLACYDLVSDATLGSPPWLAVRNTAWSDRVRPHFTHTRRTMMKVLA